jgi:hypothetical protein
MIFAAVDTNHIPGKRIARKSNYLLAMAPLNPVRTAKRCRNCHCGTNSALSSLNFRVFLTKSEDNLHFVAVQRL